MKQLPQERTNQVNLFPGPVDGVVWELNPLGFIWLPVTEASRYELRVRDEAGSLALQQALDRHYFAPTAAFAPGQYEWSVEAWDAKGTSLGTRPWWKFTMPDDAPRAVCPSAKSVLENLGEEKHPTLVFMADELEEVRRRIREEHTVDLATLKATVEHTLTIGMPPAPTFHLASTEQQKKMYYARYFGQLRPFVDMGLVACALYYLLTGDQEAGARAKELMLHICGMTPEGPNAVDGRWGDEPGLSYSRCLHGCYDWTYDLYDGREREFIENILVIYCRQTYRRLINEKFMICTGSSHMGRLPGYLGEQTILLRHRLPEAAEMLQYVLDVFNTFYPHFGGVDGGWAQGVNYGAAYNRWYIPFFTTFYKLTGFSFWQRPFYRKVKNFFLYCCATNAEYLPFGDGEEHGLTETPARLALLRPLFQFYARWFNDPKMQALVNRLPAPETFRTHIIEAFISPPKEKTAEIAPAAEGALANSRIFRGIGWAALHSDLEHPERDNFLLFKSSPFGSYSHSHADQNSVFISAGGKALAIPAGYYGPGWDAPHHHSYTRQTLSHNCILVDGEGQSGIDCLATGKLVHFEDHPGWSYVCGDATEAYKGRLSRFLRHVLFIRPAMFLIYDDLEADHPVEYSWLLHSLEAPNIDAEGTIIDIAHNGAYLHTELAASTPLTIDYTDQFATPYNEGLTEEFHHERPNQHHVCAHTEKCEQAKIAAALTVWQKGEEQPRIKVTREGDVLKVTGDDFSATMSLAPGAPSFRATIEAVEHDLLAWQVQPGSSPAPQA